MKTTMALLTINILTSFLAFGCDKVCKKTVQDVATIQNTTGKELNLKICKGRHAGEASATITASNDKLEDDLGTRQSGKVRGGPTATCDSVKDTKDKMSITLTEQSFAEVKLCYQESLGENVIVAKTASCPVDFLEQTSAGPCTENASSKTKTTK